MAPQEHERRGNAHAALPPAPLPRRVLAWIYTGPFGHLWSTVADIASLWTKWVLAGARRRAREAIRSGR